MQNMSNTVPQEFKSGPVVAAAKKKTSRVWDNKFVRKPLMWLYNKIFKIYYR